MYIFLTSLFLGKCKFFKQPHFQKVKKISFSERSLNITTNKFQITKKNPMVIFLSSQTNR